MESPTSFYVYQFSYPEAMPELAGIVFYVGRGTCLSIDDHFQEAALAQCLCAKCEAIRSVWATGLTVCKQIVFTSMDEGAAENEERRCILEHCSPYLTNYELFSPVYLGDPYGEAARCEGGHEEEQGTGSSQLATWADAVQRWAREAEARQAEEHSALRALPGQVVFWVISPLDETDED